MSDPTETARRVLDLDKQATQGPWAQQGSAATCWVDQPGGKSVIHWTGFDAASTHPGARLHDAALIAEYRTAAPELARALLESQAALANESDEQMFLRLALKSADEGNAALAKERDEARAALAAAREDRAAAEAVALARHDTISTLRADLAAARESVRELVDGLRGLLLVLPDGPTRCPACNCSWSDREIAKMRDDRAGACWCGKWAFDIDALLAKHAAPAPTPADTKAPPAAVPGLDFGDERIDGSHIAFASDGQEYNLCRARSDPRAWFWSTPGIEVRTASTADEAIAAASAHNAARLKGGES